MKKLIEKELMIGSYFIYEDTVIVINSIEEKYNNYYVTAMFPDGNLVQNISVESLEPIEVTPKLLEINSFDSGDDEFYEKDDIIINFEYNVAYMSYYKEEIDTFIINDMRFKYFHELQMLLRCCNKENVLSNFCFEVEPEEKETLDVISGNLGNYSAIIQYFINKGGANFYHLGGEASDCYYYIDDKGFIFARAKEHPFFANYTLNIIKI